MMLSGWGRFPVVYAPIVKAPRSDVELASALRYGGVIARGNGRSYGDSAISRRGTVDMRHFNRMISFDNETGTLVAEAGVLLADVISSFLPRGWFPLVTPGTKYVTLGGMIAADVHGKNHHRDGSMAKSLEWVDVMDASGQVHRASRAENPELFNSIPGAMGLTGIILRAAIRLQRVETGWIQQTMIPASNLAEAMEVFEANDQSLYSVAWIDCLKRGANRGRSLVMLGEHASLDMLSARQKLDRYAMRPRRMKRVPFDFPSFAMSGPAVKAFNALYYGSGLRKAGDSIVDWDSYFYPLDAVLNWNRVYGRKGLLQFQCVLPLETSREGLNALLDTISEAGAGSFLAVLKRFGEQISAFSFPMLGYTLALDFPATDKNLSLLERLDQITIAHGGRFYLAKDARMSAQTLMESDARTAAFIAQRRNSNASVAFQSSQSERLAL